MRQVFTEPSVTHDTTSFRETVACHAMYKADDAFSAETCFKNDNLTQCLLFAYYYGKQWWSRYPTFSKMWGQSNLDQKHLWGLLEWDGPDQSEPVLIWAKHLTVESSFVRVLLERWREMLQSLAESFSLQNGNESVRKEPYGSVYVSTSNKGSQMKKRLQEKGVFATKKRERRTTYLNIIVESIKPKNRARLQNKYAYYQAFFDLGILKSV